MSELKSCPFCGKGAVPGCEFGFTRMHYSARCQGCGARGPSFPEDEGGADAAASAWNDRSPSPAIQGSTASAGDDAPECANTPYDEGPFTIASEAEQRIHHALDEFERKERGIPQAHMAAALVRELRAALDDTPAPAHQGSTTSPPDGGKDLDAAQPENGNADD